MIEFKKEFITPEYAKELLQANIHNRKVKLGIVSRYSKDIANDKWKEDTGEALKISSTGAILDGQHRLMAIVKADKGLNLHIVRGLNDEVFKVIDTGAVRTHADIFQVSGAKNNTIIPQIIQTYILLKKGFGIKQNRQTTLTSHELLDIYVNNEAEWQSVANKVTKWYYGFSRILPTSLIGGLYSAFKDKAGEAVADEFMNQLMYGREVSSDTIFWTRKKLTEDKLSKTRLKTNIKIALLIRTWNLYRQGKQVKNLKLSDAIEGII